MATYTAVSKLLTYPTYMSVVAGHALLLPAIIDFFVGGIAVWVSAYLCSRTDKTLFELVENRIGNIAARIVFGFFAAFFLAVTLIPVLEQKAYVHNIFYDTIPSFLVFLPFFFFSVYACGKRLNNVGRCADAVMPIATASLGVVVAMGLVEADFKNLLPIFAVPANVVFRGAIVSIHKFVEPCYLLAFAGRFKYKKGDAAKITLSYTAGAVIALFVLAEFYAVYGAISPSRDFAVSMLAVFAPIIETIGRLDLLALYALEIPMLFALVLKLRLAVYCLEECTGCKNRPALSVVVNAVLLAFTWIFNNGITALGEFYARWSWIAIVIFTLVLPTAAHILRGRKTDES